MKKEEEDKEDRKEQQNCQEWLYPQYLQWSKKKKETKR